MFSKILFFLCVCILGTDAANMYSLLAHGGEHVSGQHKQFSGTREVTNRMRSAFEAHVGRSAEELLGNLEINISTSYAFFLMQERSDRKCSGVDIFWTIVYANVCYPDNLGHYVKFDLASDGTLFAATPYSYENSNCSGPGTVQTVMIGSIGCNSTTGINYSVSNTLPVPEFSAIKDV